MTTNPAPRFSVEQLLTDSRWVERLARALVARAGDDSEGEADDLIQETWVAAFQHPPGADRSARPWLAQVVRNLLAPRQLPGGRRLRRPGIGRAGGCPRRHRQPPPGGRQRRRPLITT
jgi:DNA-directed RNA polymerase specialized sigma24 family protein